MQELIENLLDNKITVDELELNELMELCSYITNLCSTVGQPAKIICLLTKIRHEIQNREGKVYEIEEK